MVDRVVYDNNLYRIMADKGISLKQLGDMSGISWRTIQNYYQGRRLLSQAHASLVIALADALGVHPRELID